MRWFNDLQISKKLLLTFSVVIMLVFALGSLALIQIAKVNTASGEIASNWLPKVRDLSQIKVALVRLRGSEAQHILLTDSAKMAGNKKSADQQEAIIDAELKKYGETLVSEPERQAFVNVKAEYARFMTDHRKVISMSLAGDKTGALEISFAMAPVYQKTLDALEHMVAINDQGALDSSATADATFSAAKMGITTLLAACVVCAAALSFWIARLISHPLAYAVTMAERIAQGDLTESVQSRAQENTKDEIGQLMFAMRGMMRSLRDIVSDVRDGTSTINTGATEIATGNFDLSSRTEHQASSLEQTASAMEELTSTVKQNAENAQQANSLSVTASDIANRGGEAVGIVVETMNGIHASSRQMADIINVIDGIAFQTNILALNAAVEAARAGEQGRGFAVVASEVRTLAQRSAAAAKDIKGLIDNSVAQVSAGRNLVEGAGKTINEVVTAVAQVRAIVSEIATSSREQTDGIEQVNLAISQIDQVTQQNAALVEEAAAAAQSLKEQASRLSQTVSIFRN